MKNVLKTLFIILMLICISPLSSLAKSVHVTTDYSKQVPIKLLNFGDLQQDEQSNIDLSNCHIVDGLLTFKYYDYGGAKNKISFKLVLTSADGSDTLTYEAELKDIIFMLNTTDDQYESPYIYLCLNRFKEKQFAIYLNKEMNMMVIFNMALIEE